MLELPLMSVITVLSPFYFSPSSALVFHELKGISFFFFFFLYI